MTRENTSQDLDHEIDAAVRMMGHVDAPAGQVERIQMRLEMAAARKEHWAPGIWVPLGCAALAAVVLAVILLPHWKHDASHRTNTVASASAPLHTTTKAETVEATGPSVVEAATSRVVRPVRPSHSRRAVKDPLDYPLTRQERLLVTLVQTASPADLEILDRARQAKLEAQKDAEFAAYAEAGDSSSSSAGSQYQAPATTQE